MKNILIPTDFTVQSLQLIVKTAETFYDEEINIILFHAFNPPSDIMELMFLKRNPLYEGLVTESFRKECRKLKMRYAHIIGAITFKHFYGNTKAVFNNFLEANEIALIVWPDEHSLFTGYKYSYSPEKLIKQCGVQILNRFAVENELDEAASFKYAKDLETSFA